MRKSDGGTTRPRGVASQIILKCTSKIRQNRLPQDLCGCFGLRPAMAIFATYACRRPGVAESGLLKSGAHPDLRLAQRQRTSVASASACLYHVLRRVPVGVMETRHRAEMQTPGRYKPGAARSGCEQERGRKVDGGASSGDLFPKGLHHSAQGVLLGSFKT